MEEFEAFAPVRTVCSFTRFNGGLGKGRAVEMKMSGQDGLDPG